MQSKQFNQGMIFGVSQVLAQYPRSETIHAAIVDTLKAAGFTQKEIASLGNEKYDLYVLDNVLKELPIE